jgi:hypothetical protein
VRFHIGRLGVVRQRSSNHEPLSISDNLHTVQDVTLRATEHYAYRWAIEYRWGGNQAVQVPFRPSSRDDVLFPSGRGMKRMRQRDSSTPSVDPLYCLVKYGR